MQLQFWPNNLKPQVLKLQEIPSEEVRPMGRLKACKVNLTHTHKASILNVF